MNMLKIGGVALLCLGFAARARAETWTPASSANNKTSPRHVFDLSGWQNGEGQPGSGRPTASDEVIVPSGLTLRCANATVRVKVVNAGTASAAAGSRMLPKGGGMMIFR